MKAIRHAIAAGAAVSLLLVCAAPASATTFCVPGFFAGCPDNGTNQARADLNAAMTDDGSDGTADKVMIDEGTLTATGSFVAQGTDPLQVTGAGADKTRLTSSATTNSYVLRTDDRPGTDMSDLTVVVPASFPDDGGNGSAGQLRDSKFTRVNVEIRNSESSGFNSLLGDNKFTDCLFYAAEGSKLDWALQTNGAVPGTTTVINSTVTGANYAFVADDQDTGFKIRSSIVADTTFTGAWAGSGGSIDIENSVFSATGGEALSVAPTPGKPKNTVINARFSTFVNEGPSPYSALDIQIPSSTTAGNGIVNIDSSIIRGYDSTWDLLVPIGPGFPKALLNIGNSNFAPVAAAGSAGTVNVSSPTNINQDPMFAGSGDFNLLPGSPSIDAGNPASTLTTDFAGDPRPRDGDGDGSSLPDQGAYEFQPTCATMPSACPVDSTAPKLSKVKFRFRQGKGGALRFRLSEKATVKVRFTPIRKKGKRKVVKITRKGKQGANVIKLGRFRLRAGRYRLTMTATDPAGNHSGKMTRNVNAQQARVQAKSDS
ncbi:MAG: hypothetical protein KDB54_03995 [Solirubrobacterales bacterium]|nr:hypothetical protein [Solirubrobacterales bacterium]MCB0859795.1 hypothetical protein [Solirubrobacterales bacterium]